MVVFPAPAGPVTDTSRSVPAIAAAAATCRSSRLDARRGARLAAIVTIRVRVDGDARRA